MSPHAAPFGTAVAAAVVALAAAQRTVYNVDAGWKFVMDSAAPPQCQNPNATFPLDYNNQQCLGLSQVRIARRRICARARWRSSARK